MAQQVTALVTKYDNLSAVPGTNKAEGKEKNLYKVVKPEHMHCGSLVLFK